MSDQAATPAVVRPSIDAHSHLGMVTDVEQSSNGDNWVVGAESAVGSVSMERAIQVVRLIKALEEA